MILVHHMEILRGWGNQTSSEDCHCKILHPAELAFTGQTKKETIKKQREEGKKKQNNELEAAKP